MAQAYYVPTALCAQITGAKANLSTIPDRSACARPVSDGAPINSCKSGTLRLAIGIARSAS